MSKGVISLCAGVGGSIGGYVPVLFGANGLSGWSILGAFIGGMIGIWVGFKIQQ